MPAPHQHRILIIDDNRAIHNDFRKILGPSVVDASGMDDIEAALFDNAPKNISAESFEIDSAFQGQEGLEFVRQSICSNRPYATAFVDMRMPPGWDGVETICKIWEVDADVQIVICTAYSDYSWEEMMGKLGQSDRLVILKKPFDNVEVTQLAQALTRKWQLAQQIRQKLNDLEQMVQTRTAELTAANQSLRIEMGERQQAEQKRLQLEAQLFQSQKLEAVGRLAAGIAHEINTPAQYIGDNTRFVKDSFATISSVLRSHEALLAAAKGSTLTPELVAQAEKILAAGDIDYLHTQIPAAIVETLEGVDRVTRIVRAMKEFSHPGSKEKAAADLNRAIESTVTVTHNEWKYVADMKLDLDPVLPHAQCFVGEFNQCVLNLIVNAAHAIQEVGKTNPGGKGLITIKTSAVNGQVEVRVSDTGTGISESVRPHIFEPFFTTKGVGKGTGQGLALIYNTIVKRHGGTVTFETKVGEGTTFVLRLPVNPQPLDQCS